MKRVDPTIELVACGSSNADMPTFAAWEATVLEHTYDQVDYISLHAYYDPDGDDDASFLASRGRPGRLHRRRRSPPPTTSAPSCAATSGSSSRFDEWNVWYQTPVHRARGPRHRATTPALIEDDYTVTDAVVVGNLLISCCGTPTG